MEKQKLIETWNNCSNTKKDILGRPNFTLGKIAHRMRDIGFVVAQKSEDEQALVIFSMLQFYEEYGSHWIDEMNKFLKQSDGK